MIRHRRRREATPIRSGSLRLVAIAAAAAFMLLFPSGGLAVHDTGAFELDGNAVAGNAPPPFGPADDWDNVCHQVTGTRLLDDASDTTSWRDLRSTGSGAAT